MRSIFAATMISLALATPASALDCSELDIVRAYDEAEASDKMFALVKGHIQMVDGATSAQDIPHDYIFPAVFTGHAFSGDGFTQEIDFALDIDVNCKGPWCGSAPGKDAGIYFIRLDMEHRYIPVLVRDPCQNTSFPASDEAVLLDHLKGN